MKKRKIGIFLFGISSLLFNCSDENNIDLIENLSIEQVNNFQSIETDEAKNLINKIVTKNKNQFHKGGFSVTIDEKSLYFSEVKKTNLNIPTFSASVKPNIHSKVFMVKKQDSVYTCLYNYIPFENKNADFLSGAIIISTIDGVFINGYKVIDGVFVSQYKQEMNSETAPKTFRKDAEPDDDWWDLGSLDEISLTLSGAGGGSIFFTNFHNPVSNQGWMNLNLSGSLFGAGGGNPNGGNGGSSNSGEMPLFPCDNPTPRGCEEEDDQIFNELTGKADCVYQKMVDNNSNINWILENFKDGNKPSQFNLKFEMSTALVNTTNASTSKSGNTFIIKINANTLSNRTSLDLARTIIHEGVHARLREFLHRKGGILSKKDFPGVYEYYRTYGKNWDHQQMADYYRSTIAKGLKQFDKGQRSDQFYNDMAWEGLANIIDANNKPNQIYTEAWKKRTVVEKNRVKSTIANEKKNGNKTCEK